ncbi:protein-arginine deiminase domain-containing protein [Myxococcota bacterium]|nr:protein-arginine deiminase domain-containing protein [Myxococcota bacterium]
MRRLGLLLLSLPLVHLGCRKDEDPGDDATTPALRVGTALGDATSAAPLDWPGLVVVPNLDDDDGDEQADYEQVLAGDDDAATLTVDAPSGFTLQLSGADLRVWHEGQVVAEDGSAAWTGPSGEGLVLLVEAGAYRASGSLTLTDAGDGQQLVLPVTGAPLILNHHLQPSELTMAVNFASTGYNNSAMIEGFEAVLGDSFDRVSGVKYQDPWLQDEVEFATASGPDQLLDVVIDSIRDGQYGPGYGLDDFAEDEFLGDGWAVGTWGRSGMANSQDYFGNLEVSPPVTVGGVSYPFGRIYYGLNGSLTPNAQIRDFLDAQAVQAPFTLDVSWLCVGHVDEFVTTVPAPGSRLGWKLVYTDVDLAWEVLEGMDPDTVLTRFASANSKPWDTVGDMLADKALRSLNEELKVDYLLPNLETLKAELELTEDDIAYIPGLFEEVSYCGGTTAAAFPGMANLIVADAPDGTTTLFVADPFIRTDTEDVASDPMAAAFVAAMPPELDVVFLDDWQVYHLNLGEVHCGSNVVRSPDPDLAWWADARHLLEAP